MKIDTKKIGLFLKGLNKAEFAYVQLCLQCAAALQNIIAKYNLSKQAVCQKLEIKSNLYNDYVTGARNYTTMDIAKINAWAADMQITEMMEKQSIGFVKHSKK